MLCIIIIKISLLKFICGVVLLGTAANVSAQTAFTSVETGLLSGSLNGTDFTNAEVTLTTVANTADISYQLLGGDIPIYIVSGITTIQISGFSLAVFTGTDLFGVFSENVSVMESGVGAVGMLDITRMSAILGFYETSPAYDFLTSVMLTGAAVADGDTYNTDQGTLEVTGTSENATFIVEAVPEPATLALSALGGLGLLLIRRRKQPKNFQPSAKSGGRFFLWLIRGRHAPSREGWPFRAGVWRRREFPTAMAARLTTIQGRQLRQIF